MGRKERVWEGAGERRGGKKRLSRDRKNVGGREGYRARREVGGKERLMGRETRENGKEGDTEWELRGKWEGRRY